MIAYPNVKVNLGLNVLRKREDGYHDLETLFFPYSEIHDVLEIVSGDDYSRTSAGLFSRYGGSSSDDGTGKCTALVQGISQDGKVMITIARKDGVDWNPLKDLTVKAYNVLDADFGLPPVKIFLEKLSPVGAGLGGGSSDAAFAVRMLNDMFSIGLDESRMAEYASRLGSDCAFFIYNRPMIGEGRGEVLTDFELPEAEISCGEHGCQSSASGSAMSCASHQDVSAESKGRYVLKVVVPEGVSVSTADAYRGIVPSLPEMSLRDVLSLPVTQWKGHLKNDFESTVFAKFPQLKAIKDSLYESGAVYASMSGSGSALYAIYK